MTFDDISIFFISIVYYVKKYDRHIPEHRNKRQKTNNNEMNLHISNENIGNFFFCFLFIYYILRYIIIVVLIYFFFFYKFKHIVFVSIILNHYRTYTIKWYPNFF